MIEFDQIKSFSDDQLDFACFERGIQVDSRSNEKKVKDLKLWLSISNLSNVPDSLLLFSRLLQDEEDMFDFDRDEGEYEILRRSPQEVYYYEKLRVFEKTFGIDDLKKLVGKIDEKRMNAINSETRAEDRIIFTPEEREAYVDIMEQFKQRHQTIKDDIETSYKKGHSMLEFIQNQIILDHLLKGKQSQLDAENPELAKKAKALVGYEKYYQAQAQGEEDQTSLHEFLHEKLSK